MSTPAAVSRALSMNSPDTSLRDFNPSVNAENACVAIPVSHRSRCSVGERRTAPRAARASRSRRLLQGSSLSPVLP